MSAAHASNVSYRILRELGARSQPSFAAVRAPQELVVVQRFRRDELGAEKTALLLRDARALAKSWHPNLARVRHVDLIGSELWVASELYEGATLADVGPRVMELPVLLRILVDVLHGLSHLHALRDGIRQPLEAIHGELGPANVVVGRDGIARVVDIFRPRPCRVGAASESLCYAAPEALESEGTIDERSDLFAVGVMLWEGLAGKRLRIGEDPAAIRQAQREEDTPVLDADPVLVAIASRAMAFDRALRYRSATEMAADLRGQKLAAASVVAELVDKRALARIRERGLELDPGASGARMRQADTIPDRVARGPVAPPAWSRALLGPVKKVSPAKSNPPGPAPDEKVIIEPPPMRALPTPGPMSATMPPAKPGPKRRSKLLVFAAFAAALSSVVTFALLDRKTGVAVSAPPSVEDPIVNEPVKPNEIVIPAPVEAPPPKAAVSAPREPTSPRPRFVPTPVATPPAKPKKPYDPSEI